MPDGSPVTFRHIAFDRFLHDLEVVATAIETRDWRPDFIVGIGRGGLVPGTFLSHRMAIALLSIDFSSEVPAFADALLAEIAAGTNGGRRYLLVDDINDSGKTIAALRRAIVGHGGLAENVRFAVLINNVRSSEVVDYTSSTIDRSIDKDWFVFPWEAVAPVQAHVRDALAEPNRLGLPRGRAQG